MEKKGQEEMSVMSDDDNEGAMKAILKLADPEDGYRDLSLEDAIQRLQKITAIAEGGDYEEEEAEAEEY